MVEPKRILLIRLSHLGDVVHALPVFHALRAAFPRAALGWVVQPEFSALVAGLPGLDRVLHFERRGGAGAWLHLREQLGAFQADLAVDAQGNLKSALVALTSGAPRRVGLARSDWREPLGSLACTELATAATGPHALDRMLGLARHVSGEVGEVPRCDPDLQPAELAAGRAEVERLFGADATDRVILQLSDAADVRSWPAEHALGLIAELEQQGRAVVVLSGPGEAELGARIAAARPDSALVRHWVGQRGLRELAAFFHAAAETGARFVGTDSGPMHLAWSCGLGVVALAGPQSHLATGPWPVPSAPSAPSASGPHRIVRATPAPPCAPCLSRRCDHAEGPVCMRDLRPAAVLEALCAKDLPLAPNGSPRPTA